LTSPTSGAYDFSIERSSMPTRGPLTLKTFLTATMSVLSVLVFGLGAMQRDPLWLWIGFICCLISGVFIQLSINRIKSDIASGRR
jgi:preprotein translocase subunit SecF